MESKFSDKYLAMEDRAFKAPDQGSSSDRASPLNPLQYDETFGRNGKLFINMGGRPTSWVSSIVPMHTSSKYLATYYEAGIGGPGGQNNAGLVCFYASGKVDTSFGTRGDGTVELKLGATDLSFPRHVIELENGQLLVVGYHRRMTGVQFMHVMITRLESDGSVDTSFGDQGLLNVTALAERDMLIVGAVSLPDGKIVLLTIIAEEGPARSLLIKLTADGQLDETFAGQGIWEFQRSAAKSTLLYGLKLTATGSRLLTYGAYPGPAGYSVGFMARFDPDGILDPDFGQKGFVDIEPEEETVIHDVSISSDETHLLVSGIHNNRTSVIGDSLLAKHLANGKADESFNQGEPVYLQFHPTSIYDIWNDARTLMDGTGKIVVFGYSIKGNEHWSAAGRFHSTGKPDTKFTGDSSVGSPSNAEFLSRSSYVQGANPTTILCAGNAEGYAAVLAIKV